MSVTIFSGQTLRFICLHILLQKPKENDAGQEADVLKVLNGYSAVFRLKRPPKLCCVKCHSGVLSGHAGRSTPLASLWRKQRSEQWLTARLNLDSGSGEGQGRVEGGQRRGRQRGEGGMLGLRLREQEGEREKRERGKEIYRAESMCSQ